MPRKERRNPVRDSRRQLISDPNRPKSVRIRINGKTITVKKKVKWDRGRSTEMCEGFLKLLKEGLTDKDAAAAVGCSTRYFRKRRKEDPDFEEAYQEARLDGNDVIRAEIQRRAVDGVLTPVFHDGKVCGHKRVYSDSLLIHQSKARMPEEYGDRITQNHTHKLDGAAEALVDKMAKMLGVPNPDAPPENQDLIDITPTDDN